MDDLNLNQEATDRLDKHVEQVIEALEMGEESKRNFRDLLEALGDAMNFDLVPPKDMQQSLRELQNKIDMDVVSLMEMDINDIIAHAWYLTQMYSFIAAKQAWCEARSIQLKYAIKNNEYGVTWLLSKKTRTLAERIQKGLTNPDKEAIAGMTSVKEGQMEVYFYFVSKLLKGIMDSIHQQQRILSDRHQKLFSEWRDSTKKGFNDGPASNMRQN